MLLFLGDFYDMFTLLMIYFGSINIIGYYISDLNEFMKCINGSDLNFKH